MERPAGLASVKNRPAWIDSRAGRPPVPRGAGSAPPRRPRDGGPAAGPAPRTRRRSARRPAPRHPGSRAGRAVPVTRSSKARPSGTVAPTPARSARRLTPMPNAGVTSRPHEHHEARPPHLPAEAGAAEEALLPLEARARGVGRVAGPRLEQERAPRREDARPLERGEVRQVRAADLVRPHVLQRVLERGRGPAAQRALEAEPSREGSGRRSGPASRTRCGSSARRAAATGAAPVLRSPRPAATERVFTSGSETPCSSRIAGRVAVAEAARGVGPPIGAGRRPVVALQADLAVVAAELAAGPDSRSIRPPAWRAGAARAPRRSAPGRPRGSSDAPLGPSGTRKSMLLSQPAPGASAYSQSRGRAARAEVGRGLDRFRGQRGHRPASGPATGRGERERQQGGRGTPRPARHDAGWQRDVEQQLLQLDDLGADAVAGLPPAGGIELRVARGAHGDAGGVALHRAPQHPAQPPRVVRGA